MWGCNLYSDMPFVGSLFSNGFFSLLLWVAIILTLVFVLIRIFRQTRNSTEGNIRDSEDSLEFLKIRYAKGEIGHEDYIRMKQILPRS
jgi:putative membrane protein